MRIKSTNLMRIALTLLLTVLTATTAWASVTQYKYNITATLTPDNNWDSDGYFTNNYMMLVDGIGQCNFGYDQLFNPGSINIAYYGYYKRDDQQVWDDEIGGYIDFWGFEKNIDGSKNGVQLQQNDFSVKLNDYVTINFKYKGAVTSYEISYESDLNTAEAWYYHKPTLSPANSYVNAVLHCYQWYTLRRLIMRDANGNETKLSVTKGTYEYAENEYYYGCAGQTVDAYFISFPMPAKDVTIRAVFNKLTPTVTAPTAITGLVYNGQPQPLINAGSTTGGTMMYKLDDGEWGTSIPQATKIGNHYVSYKVVGNDEYEDVAEKKFQVYIALCPVTVTVTGHTLTATYDGQSHSVSGYDLSISNSLYQASYLTCNKTFKVTTTHAGKEFAYISSGDFINNNVNFAVTFDTSPCYVEILQRPIVVTAQNVTKEMGELDNLTATVTGLALGEQPDIIQYNLSRQKGETVGTYTVTPVGYASQGDYTVTFVPGTLTITSNPTDLSVNDAHTEYTIHNDVGWYRFCNMVDAGETFSGKTVKLDANIGMDYAPVGRMAGSSDHRFGGTFDGGGKTLTIRYGTNDSPTTEEYTAPLRHVSTATVRDLHVVGDIYTSAKYAAGIVGQNTGQLTVDDCLSSVNIHSTVSGDGTHGGLVAAASGTVSITGCVFNGSLLGTNTEKCGGFIGWRGTGANIYNSLFIPADVTVKTDGSATFARNKVDTYNCYFTHAFFNSDYNPSYAPYDPNDAEHPDKYNNGKQGHRILAGTNTILAISGTPTTYRVSGITAYSDGDTRLAGLKYGDVLYAAAGESLSLTTPGTLPADYQYSYTASAGTLNGSTLVMPDADVTVTAVIPSTTVPVAMNSSGIMSYASAAPLDFSGVDGLTAYVATAISDGTLTLTPATQVPAGTGLLLKGTPGETFSVPTTGTATAIASNLLVGLVAATDVNSHQTIQGTDHLTFILANGAYGINWYPLAEDHYLLRAGSAYLRLPASDAPTTARALTMKFDDEATAIIDATRLNNNEEIIKAAGEWYTLDGRKLNRRPTQKGLYIFNGTKVTIK